MPDFTVGGDVANLVEMAMGIDVPLTMKVRPIFSYASRVHFDERRYAIRWRPLHEVRDLAIAPLSAGLICFLRWPISHYRCHPLGRWRMAKWLFHWVLEIPREHQSTESGTDSALVRVHTNFCTETHLDDTQMKAHNAPPAPRTNLRVGTIKRRHLVTRCFRSRNDCP